MDVVVGRPRVRRRGPGQQQEARRGVRQPTDGPRLAAEEVAVGDRQVRVEHDRVAGDALAVGGVHGDRPGALRLHPGHLGAVADHGAVLLGGAGQGSWDRVHAALREEDAGHRVHVGDDGVDGQGVVGREAGVHRLEGEDPLGARVLEVVVHLGRQPAEAADRGQPREVGGQQVERGVDVAVDEVAHLVAVELGHEVDVAPVPRCLVRAADPLDLVGHRVDVAVHVQRRAVGVERAVERRHRVEVQPVLEPLADAVQGVGDEVRHREDRRTGVEAVAVDLEEPRPPAGDLLALEDRHLPAGAEQAQGGGQPAEPRTDHDHVVGGSLDGAHAFERRRAAAGAQAGQGQSKSQRQRRSNGGPAAGWPVGRTFRVGWRPGAQVSERERSSTRIRLLFGQFSGLWIEIGVCVRSRRSDRPVTPISTKGQPTHTNGPSITRAGALLPLLRLCP